MGTVGATLLATSLLRKRFGSSALREGVVQVVGAAPAFVALLDRDLAAYHGVEHKAIAAYEQGIDDPAGVPKEHDRCGSNLIAPMMLLSVGGTLLLERTVERPSPAARAVVGLAGASIAVEMFAWSDRHHGDPLAEAFHAPGREIQRRIATKEPTPSSWRSESRRWPRSCGPRTPRRLPPVFGRIDHIGVAVEDLDAAIELYEKSFGMELGLRETVAEQGVDAALLGVGEDHVELMAATGPDTPVGKFIAKRGAGLHHVAYAVDDIDSVLVQLAAGGIELIDAEARAGIGGSRVAFLQPRSTGRVLTEIVEPPEGGH